MDSFIGIDIGTSACRACAIDDQARVLAEARIPLPAPARSGDHVEQDPAIWWQCLLETLDALNPRIAHTRIRRLALDGTSATLLLCAPDGTPYTQGLMYNDCRAMAPAERIRQAAPADSAANSPCSSLAKLLYLKDRIAAQDYLALHQADWLSSRLTGNFGISDENNALKLGYDPLARRWPDWLRSLNLADGCLPDVVAPGAYVGTVRKTLAARWNWTSAVEVVAGTTDSTAGFIATGAQRDATAVTALGSTLVLKVLSPQPVFNARHGIYSHRLGERWLVGGASNAGGAVLRRFFGPCDIKRYSRLLDPSRSTGLDYYPLPAIGERFPVADPELQPRLSPRPASDREFFQGLLEGLARIEQQGYRRLAAFGAPYPQQVITVGGGAANRAWTQIRRGMLGIPVTCAAQQEAAYGAALLALRR
ncbi:MAG: FGGY-family carbohydrate kinase [Thiogranum sp.]|nr:FGGY-family carbohydrate kinase [Thiogranum sp.]